MAMVATGLWWSWRCNVIYCEVAMVLARVQVVVAIGFTRVIIE